MNVPLVDLKLQYQSIKQELDKSISRVLHSGNYVMGTEVEAFESEWADYCKAKYCVGFSSGSDALYAAVRLLVKREERVMTTPFTFFATSWAIIRAGCIPIYIDVDNWTGNLPPEDFKDEVALPVHLYGRPGDWKGSRLIEDSAQAHGLPLNVSGRISIYSFYPTKNLGAMGQAGALVTNDEGIASLARELRNYCERERFIHHGTAGGNFRMDELQAAILRAKLPHLGEWNRLRRGIAQMYRSFLLDLIKEEEEIREVDSIHVDSIHRGLYRWVRLPEDHPRHVYHIFAIRASNRDGLRAYLSGQGIQTSIRYPVPMHLQPALRGLGYSEGDFPHAEAWARENLSLPMYPELNANQVEYICDKVKEWVRRR